MEGGVNVVLRQTINPKWLKVCLGFYREEGFYVLYQKGMGTIIINELTSGQYSLALVH